MSLQFECVICIGRTGVAGQGALAPLSVRELLESAKHAKKVEQVWGLGRNPHSTLRATGLGDITSPSRSKDVCCLYRKMGNFPMPSELRMVSPFTGLWMFNKWQCMLYFSLECYALSFLRYKITSWCLLQHCIAISRSLDLILLKILKNSCPSTIV